MPAPVSDFKGALFFVAGPVACVASSYTDLMLPELEVFWMERHPLAHFLAVCLLSALAFHRPFGCSVMGLSSILIEATLILDSVKGPITLPDISPYFPFLSFRMTRCVL